MTERTVSDQAVNELKIVRKFLHRNNLMLLVKLLKEACDHICGAKVALPGIEVAENERTAVPFSRIDWDSVGFFEPSKPTRLTVPAGLGGRFLVQAATRWLDHREPVGGEPPSGAYYYAFVMRNGSAQADGNDARCTVNRVGGDATGTTQHFMYETELAEGEFVELWLWQNLGSPIHCDVHFEIRRIGC